ncbi:histidine--tRNA ligase [Candidatus Woesearchaeota archaeon]|nr:histidine--tRNA ligase [Candidatus Woesearchaeota archaeon]
MNLELPKGTRDTPPEERIAKTKLFKGLKVVFESFGFSQLDTPIIEKLEVLTAKYAGGEEILKEIFKVKDQGNRELGLRYDLTVPLARYIGMNPNVKLPFKRYAIGQVFRDGPIKLGRYREFWQCDVDIVGSMSMLADAQIIEIALTYFSHIHLDVVAEVNNRKILDGIMETAGIPEKKWMEVILSIDKLKKIGKLGVEKELHEKSIGEDQTEEIMNIITIEGSNQDKLKQLKKMLNSKIGKEGLQEVEELLSYVPDKRVQFNVSLARGLAYYTSTVFEVFAPESIIASSLAGGGRYDNMIGAYLENNQEYPAVGISFGIEPINDILKDKHKDKPQPKTVTELYIVPIKTEKICLEIAQTLRKESLKVDMDIMQRGVSKNLAYVSAYNIPFALIIGEKELKEKKFTLRDMVSGKEENVGLKVIKEKIKSK